MLKVDTTYIKAGVKIHHVGADQTFVPPQIGPSLRILVGEAAGEEESKQGKPFVGAAGKFLDSLLRKAGINRDELTIVNTLQCRPPGNHYPGDPASRGYCSEQTAKEIIRHCYKNHVREVLLSRPWRRLDIVGAHALRLLTGKGNILMWRGSPLEVDTDEIDKRMNV